MNRRPAVFLIALFITLSLGFGGIAHAFAPHDHSHDSRIADLMHSALRHEDKKALYVPLVALFLSATISFLALSVAPRQSLVQLELTVRARSSQMLALRRGIAPYRRFG